MLDDFYGWIKPHDLYRILDRYRYQAPVKFGFTWARYKYVWITSNSSPSSFYKQAVMESLDTTAYNRRFHNIYRLDYYMGAKDAICVPIIEKEDKKLTFPVTISTPVNEEESVHNTNVSDSEDIS